MAAVNRVYAARLAGMVVLGPDGESIGRVRDVVISISIVRHQPRVLGLVVELLTRRRIFVPIGRVTAIDPSAVTLITANVSLRKLWRAALTSAALARCGDGSEEKEREGVGARGRARARERERERERKERLR